MNSHIASVKIERKNGISVALIELKEAVAFPKELAARLLLLRPNLKLHPCETGFVGGFILSLERGTTWAHVVEHLLIDEIGYGRITFGQTVDGKRIALEGDFGSSDLIDALGRATELLNSLTRESGDGEHPQSAKGTPNRPAGGR